MTPGCIGKNTACSPQGKPHLALPLHFGELSVSAALQPLASFAYHPCAKPSKCISRAGTLSKHLLLDNQVTSSLPTHSSEYNLQPILLGIPLTPRDLTL